MLIHKGRLSIDVRISGIHKLILESNEYILLGITPEIAELSTDLFSDNNKDPADRIIAATSIIENAKLITADKKLRQSPKSCYYLVNQKNNKSRLKSAANPQRPQQTPIRKACPPPALTQKSIDYF